MSQEQYVEVNNELTNISSKLNNLHAYPFWQRKSGDISELLDKLLEVRRFIISHKISEFAPLLAQHYNSVFNHLQQPPRILKEIYLDQYFQLIEQINNYSSQVDAYVSNNFNYNNKVPFTFSPFWNLMSEIAAIDDSTIRFELKELFHQKISANLLIFHAKLYRPVFAFMEELNSEDICNVAPFF